MFMHVESSSGAINAIRGANLCVAIRMMYSSTT